MTHTHKTTRILFWAAFGAFLAVSIPHIAWVFRQYEPRTDTNAFNLAWWALAFGFAIAIDAVTAWLSFIESQGDEQGGQLVAWLFIAVLALMSWYFNWIFSLAHDPAHPGANVWDYSIIDAWWIVPQMTIGWLTPLIISAMPVFVIAYTFVLNKVATMKAQAAKSLEELQREADEAQLRAEAERRIREARRGQNGLEKGLQLGKGLISAAHELGTEIEKQKRDPQTEQLQKLVQFFRSTPDLLQDENADAANTMIKQLIRVKSSKIANAWRLKVLQTLAQETASLSDNTPPETPTDNEKHSDQTADEFSSIDDQQYEPSPNISFHEGEFVTDPSLTELRSVFERSSDGNPNTDTETTLAMLNRSSDDFSTENGTSSRPRGPRYISIQEASDLTGYAVSTLERKLYTGEIERHPDDKKRVKVTSLRALKRSKHRESAAENIPVLETVR